MAKKSPANKPKLIKSFEKLDEKMLALIDELYPEGYKNYIETLDIGGGKFMSALRVETEQYTYLIKFPIAEPVDADDDELGQDEEMHLEGCDDQDDEEQEQFDTPDPENDIPEETVDNFDDYDQVDESTEER